MEWSPPSLFAHSFSPTVCFTQKDKLETLEVIGTFATPFPFSTTKSMVTALPKPLFHV